MKEFLKTGIILKQPKLLFLLILVISTTSSVVLSQDIRQKPTRQSSLETFSNGNYEQAYKDFQLLLKTYSKDPLYKYYSGVCLVKLNRNPEEAVSLLAQSIQNAALIKTLPSEARFYLGRAQQMAGRFADAIKSFNLFTQEAGKKASKELGVPEFIKQCYEKSGQITEADSIKELPHNIEITDSIKTKISVVLPEALQQPVRKNSIPVTYLSSANDKILNEAIDFQFKSDSVSLIVQQQEQDFDNLTSEEKQILKNKIAENKALVAFYQKSANQKYAEAQVVLNPQQQIPLQPYVIKAKLDSIPKPVATDLNSAAQQTNNNPIKNIDNQIDTIRKVLSLIQKQPESYSLFEVLDKPVSDPKEKIVVDGEVPAGLIYRIQIAVFRNAVSSIYFKGIRPVFGFTIPGSDKKNYYAGMFRRVSDAGKALLKVKARGFKDAFIVAFSGNKPISADRAAVMEKEWGQKPFVNINQSAQVTPLDTIPPALSFRVEVLRSLKPLKDDATEAIKKITGNKGLDIQPADDGKIAYLVGNFITFESAAEYADLLIRNGYREAKVVAFLGKREIPLETAKQLFENLE